MNPKWLRRGLETAVLTSAFALVASGVASADVTSGDGGVGSGNQIHAPVAAPVNVCGNAIAIAADATAFCEGGAAVISGGESGWDMTSGDFGFVSGNQIDAPVAVPVNVCGNAIAIAGDAFAACEGGAHVVTPPKDECPCPPVEEPPADECPCPPEDYKPPVDECPCPPGDHKPPADECPCPPGDHKPPVDECPCPPVEEPPTDECPCPPVEEPPADECPCPDGKDGDDRDGNGASDHVPPSGVTPASSDDLVQAANVGAPTALASTGTDSRTLVPAAALMLLVGSALIAVSRRKVARR